MATLSNLNLSLPSTISGDIPPNLYNAINDLYIAFAVLVNLLNTATPVMMSPNGHYWTGVISNAGTVTWTDVGTTRP